ncbi:MAG: hypothetical protein IPO31_05110 [Candidatus Obscuribacter sp.]|nr:hypothetical protein [Candidatus Obscuribacter sp.]
MPEFKTDTSALSSAPSPMRRHRFVQATCLFSAIAHTAATLICVYAFREGNFAQFSPAKLMQFVPEHMFLWRTSCLLVLLSSISTLVFILAMREVLEEKYRYLVGIAVCLSIVACGQDVEAIGRMMVLFGDIALQGYIRQDSVQLGWLLINQSLTETFMMANLLYGMAGLCIALCLTKTRVLPRTLAIAHLPVWSIMLLASVSTFLGYLPVSIVLVFTSNLALSVLSAFSGVAIDAMLPTHDPVAAKNNKSTESTATISAPEHVREPGSDEPSDMDNSGFF